MRRQTALRLNTATAYRHQGLAIINSRRGKLDPFLRIHAMKFYNLAMAPKSMVRAGQDLADDFVEYKDFGSAKEVMEQHVIPVVNETGLIHRLVQVRSQYAVILALAGQHRQARAEIQRLTPYLNDLTDEQCYEVAGQADYIEHLGQQANRASMVNIFGKVGRNETCRVGQVKSTKNVMVRES